MTFLSLSAAELAVEFVRDPYAAVLALAELTPYLMLRDDRNIKLRHDANTKLLDDPDSKPRNENAKRRDDLQFLSFQLKSIFEAMDLAKDHSPAIAKFCNDMATGKSPKISEAVAILESVPLSYSGHEDLDPKEEKKLEARGRKNIDDRLNNWACRLGSYLNHFTASLRVEQSLLHFVPSCEFLQSPRDAIGDLKKMDSKIRADAADMPVSVNAKQLSDHAGCGSRTIRKTLTDCKPVSTGKGRAGHQWRYCDTLPILRAVKTGYLADVIWPDSAAELKQKEDSSKIPARILKR